MKGAENMRTIRLTGTRQIKVKPDVTHITISLEGNPRFDYTSMINKAGWREDLGW